VPQIPSRASGAWACRHPHSEGLLTKDENRINRSDMAEDVARIVRAVPDEQLRAQIDLYLLRALEPDATERQKRWVYADLFVRSNSYVLEFTRTFSDCQHRLEHEHVPA